MDSTFIDKLRQYFEDKGITQKSIASLLNVDPAYINKLLTGKKAFGKKTAQQFQDLYGLSASWLLTGEGTMLVDNSATNGSHSSQAVGDGAMATHSEGVKECLEIIRKQQESIDKLVDAIAALSHSTSRTSRT